MTAESSASTFLSITPQGALSEIQPSTFKTATRQHPVVNMVPPSICIRSNTVPPGGTTSSFSFDAHLPMVHVIFSKPVLDGLTFWADDFAQCLFGDSERASASDTSGRSRDPSIIGSRFFAKRTASTGSSESGRESRKGELVVKVSIGEGKPVPEALMSNAQRSLSATQVPCPSQGQRFTGTSPGPQGFGHRSSG